MMKKKPPKRPVLKDGIPLESKQNLRFLRFAKNKGLDQTIKEFIVQTGLYLRGRCGGSARSKTEPCGYLFISMDSFAKGHRAVAHFGPMPSSTRLKISFRLWSEVHPFSKKEWNSLDDDRVQKRMKAIELTSDKKLKRAIRLAKTARKTFEGAFDLSIDLMKASKSKVAKKS